MNNPITIACTFDSATRRKDRTVKLSFSSNLEVSTDDFMELDKRLLSSGWVLFQDNEVQPGQIPDVPADEAYGKMSPSQEMRWLLKKLWEQNPGDMEWPDYYRDRMRRMSDVLKEKLS